MNRIAAAALTLLSLALAGLPATAQGSLSKPAAGIDMKAAPGSFSSLARRLMPAVVNISTEQVIASGMPTFPEGSPPNGSMNTSDATMTGSSARVRSAPASS